MDYYPRHMSVSEGPSKTPSPNPTFIKSMEQSKFSSLASQQNDDQWVSLSQVYNKHNLVDGWRKIVLSSGQL